MEHLFRKRIVIIEDNVTLNQGYKFLLDGMEEYQVTGAYYSCEDAIKQLESDRPDIIIIDLELPGMNGIEGIKSIKDKISQVEILVTTVYENSQLVFEALQAGASGYISKRFGMESLLKALRELAGGGAPMSSNIARMVVNSFHVNPSTPLSKRETEVLKFISDGQTYSMIADHMQISSETVKTHIKNIYKKLNVNSKSDAVHFAKRERFI